MAMMAPWVKTGFITAEFNLLLAVLLGFLFGFALQRSGFTDSKKITGVFYMKDVDVPVVMFTAIVTAAIGFWTLSLLGFVDTSKLYFLPTYMMPMMAGGFVMGMGMVIGGYCPGTAIASAGTGRLDALVFLLGVMLGSLVFGDFYAVWASWYESGYVGVLRLDQWLGINLGSGVLLIAVGAIGASIGLRALQQRFWHNVAAQRSYVPSALIVGGLATALAIAFSPTDRFFAIERTAGAVEGWLNATHDPFEQVVVSPLAAGRILYDNADRSIILDVREADAFAENHFPGALHVTPASLRRVDLPSSSIVVVYGADTAASQKGMATLRKHGHVRAFAVEGGFSELKRYYVDPVSQSLLAGLSRKDRRELPMLRTALAAGDWHPLDKAHATYTSIIGKEGSRTDQDS